METLLPTDTGLDLAGGGEEGLRTTDKDDGAPGFRHFGF
jgi:hypothetical protein